MNKYIGQQFAALRYEKNILVVEETTSAGGCGSFNAASSCPASASRSQDLSSSREIRSFDDL